MTEFPLTTICLLHCHIINQSLSQLYPEAKAVMGESAHDVGSKGSTLFRKVRCCEGTKNM